MRENFKYLKFEKKKNYEEFCYIVKEEEKQSIFTHCRFFPLLGIFIGGNRFFEISLQNSYDLNKILKRLDRKIVKEDPSESIYNIEGITERTITNISVNNEFYHNRILSYLELLLKQNFIKLSEFYDAKCKFYEKKLFRKNDL